MPVRQISKLKDVPTVIPMENVYNRDLNPGVPADRITVRIPSQISRVTESSNQMIFDIPNSSVMDFRQGGLQFKLSVSATGGTYARASNGVHTGIQRVRVLFDSEVIEDLNSFGLITSMLAVSGDPDYASSLGYVMAGFGNATRRNTLGSNNQSYVISLLLGSLRKPLPLNMITSRLRIEVYWQPANVWIETDGTSPTYTITDINLYADQMNFGSEYIAQLKKTFMEEGHISIPYLSYESFTNSVTNAGTNSLQIPAKKRSLKGLASVMRTASTVADPTVNDKFETYNNLNIGLDVRTYQAKINNTFYPQVAIATEAALNGPTDAIGNPIGYYNMLRLLRQWNFYRPFSLNSNLAQNYFIDRFIMAINVAPHQSQIMSGLDTATNFSTILLNIDLTALPSNQELTTFTIYDAVMHIDASTGRVRKFD